MKSISLIFLAIFLALPFMSLHAQKEVKVKKTIKQTKQEADIDKVIKLLIELPDWGYKTPAEDKSKYLSIASSVSKYGSDTIKLAEHKYINSSEIDVTTHLSRMGRLFLFQKVLFKLPSEFVPYKNVFGGFGIVPKDTKDGKINWLLPLAENEKGELELIGGIAFMRDRYDPVSEFEYFEKEFGRRKVFK